MDKKRGIAMGLGIAALVTAGIAYASVVSGLLPTSDGTYKAWTPSTGTTHYTLVDESSCNGTTDYNSTTITGNRDSYGISLSGVPNGAVVSGIAIKPCASRNSSGGGSATMNVFYRWNGTNSADAGAYALTGTTPVNLATTTFSGLALNKRSSNTAEIGAIYSSGTKGARLSRIAAEITYSITAPSDPYSLSETHDFATSTPYILLSWSSTSTNELGFKVERGTDGVNFSQIGTSSENYTSYFDSAIITGSSTTYYYRVKAYNDSYDSGYTNTVSVFVP